MKNILLLFFTCLSFSLIAQSNELVFSYQPFNNNDFGRQTSMSYYKYISQKTAIGIRTSVRVFDQAEYLKYDDDIKIYSGNIDFLSSWNLVQYKKIRLRADLGLTLKRERQYQWIIDPLFCGVIDPRFPSSSYTHMSEDNPMANQFGYTSGLALDLFIIKNLFLGINYNLKAYLPNDRSISEEIDYDSILALNFGTKF